MLVQGKKDFAETKMFQKPKFAQDFVIPFAMKQHITSKEMNKTHFVFAVEHLESQKKSKKTKSAKTNKKNQCLDPFDLFSVFRIVPDPLKVIEFRDSG